MMKLLMKGAAITAFSLVALLTFALPASAAPNDHIGPFAASTNDGGSCGNDWAVDNYTLTVAVKSRGANTYDLKFDYKNATFTTLPGKSPGACNNGIVNDTGKTVAGGIQGNFNGTLSETVTSASYNPNGCSAPLADCTSRTGIITALFGAAAPASGSDFKYNFEYQSNDKTLSSRHWQDRSGPNGDIFVGDIAN